MSTTTIEHLAVVAAPLNPGDLITGPGQIQWNGLLLGEGTPYCTDTLAGWESLPGVDRSSTPRARRHGAYPGTVLAQEQIVSWSGTVFSGGDSTYEARRTLMAATALPDTPEAVESPLVIRTDDVLAMRWAQVIARVIPLAGAYRRYITGVEIQWSCSDPLLYLLPDDGTASYTQAVHLPSRGPGFNYPLVYPIDYGQPGDPGSATVENTGTAGSPATYTVWGECSQPSIYLEAPDGTVKVLTLGLDLAGGEWVTVNARTGEVLLSGVADRSGAVTGALPEDMLLAPGVNLISFRAVAGDPDTAELDVDWLPAEM